MSPNTFNNLTDHDPLPIASFEVYEQLCNENNQSARRNGILSSEIYADVIADETSTVFVEIQGTRVPVLVDAKYGLGLGYDESRVRDYAKDLSSEVSILALPVGELSKDVQQRVVRMLTSSGPRAVYFPDHNNEDSRVLYEAFEEQLIEYSEVPLPDHRCRPENRQASISLYICDVTQVDLESRNGSRKSLADIQKYYDINTLPTVTDPENSSVLETSSNLTTTQLDNMWELFVDRFELLGENHPISMEDTKEDFLNFLKDEDTMLATKYVDGKPVCFVYFTENLEKLYWLNNKYLEQFQSVDESLTPLFFPGIVASGSGGNHAGEVIGLFANHVASAGVNVRVFFENTNLSEMYVPRIVKESISVESRLAVTQPQKIDETVYRLINLQPSHAN